MHGLRGMGQTCLRRGFHAQSVRPFAIAVWFDDFSFAEIEP
jgi:hypothetical protein